MALLLLLSLASLAAAALPESQVQALWDLYHSTNGQYWENQLYRESFWTPGEDACFMQWFGVTCDVTNSTVM